MMNCMSLKGGKRLERNAPQASGEKRVIAEYFCSDLFFGFLKKRFSFDPIDIDCLQSDYGVSLLDKPNVKYVFN